MFSRSSPAPSSAPISQPSGLTLSMSSSQESGTGVQVSLSLRTTPSTLAMRPEPPTMSSSSEDPWIIPGSSWDSQSAYTPWKVGPGDQPFGPTQDPESSHTPVVPYVDTGPPSLCDPPLTLPPYQVSADRMSAFGSQGHPLFLCVPTAEGTRRTISTGLTVLLPCVSRLFLSCLCNVY
jgi:hypothetical protein